MGIDASAAMLKEAARGDRAATTLKIGAEGVGSASKGAESAGSAGAAGAANVVGCSAANSRAAGSAAVEGDPARQAAASPRSMSPAGGGACDFVQCNFGHRLPFRNGSFGPSSSTSAVHSLWMQLQYKTPVS